MVVLCLRFLYNYIVFDFVHLVLGLLCLLQEVKQQLKRINIIGCRYDERLNAKTEGSKRLAYTVFEFEHIYYETIKVRVKRQNLYMSVGVMKD